MIEIIRELMEDRDPKSPTLHDAFTVLVDNILLDNASVVRRSRTHTLFILIRDEGDSERILSQRFSELPPDVDGIELKLQFQWSELVSKVLIDRLDGLQGHKISFKFDFNFEDWKGPYSFSEYGEEFRRVIETKNNPAITWLTEDKEGLTNGFYVRISPSLPQELIENEMERCSILVRDMSEETRRSLLEKARIDSVVMYFDFPKQVQVPCEQYLFYFVQFLRDLGIEATAELQQEVGQVLFAVTPTDAKLALDKIRIALEIYLRLPSSAIIDSSLNDSEIAIQRLAANIHHLKSQLLLSRAEIQASERIVEAQHYMNVSQQQLLRGLLSGEIIIQSAKPPTQQERSEDKEELLQGAFAITKWKGKGIEVNLPDIYRRLKRFITGKE